MVLRSVLVIVLGKLCDGLFPLEVGDDLQLADQIRDLDEGDRSVHYLALHVWHKQDERSELVRVHREAFKRVALPLERVY